jgi:hypothetical protein
MMNLLIVAGAAIAALRILSPWLRIAMAVVMRLVEFAFFLAVAILIAIAILSHGAFL